MQSSTTQASAVQGAAPPRPAVKRRSSQWDISRRWTPALVADGYTPVPTAFLAHYGAMNITSPEAMLIIHLMSHKWDHKNPFPTFARLAGRMSMSETAARGHARSLEKKKLLRRIKRPGRSNEFDLTPLFQRLEFAQAEAVRKRNSVYPE